MAATITAWVSFDGVLIKDNHIAACGSVTAAVERARTSVHHLLKIQIEAKSLEQVAEALEAGADGILLDNMSPEMMATAVEMAQGRAFTEASGGITLESVRDAARTGVDFNLGGHANALSSGIRY